MWGNLMEVNKKYHEGFSPLHSIFCLPPSNYPIPFRCGSITLTLRESLALSHVWDESRHCQHPRHIPQICQFFSANLTLPVSVLLSLSLFSRTVERPSAHMQEVPELLGINTLRKQPSTHAP